MPKNPYEEFIEAVISEDGMLWACWATSQTRTYTAINATHRLVVKLRLLHPEMSKRYPGGWSWRRSEPFDVSKHYHRYEFECTDPAFRWGRSKVLFIQARPGHPFYEYLKGIHTNLRTKAHLVTQERPFDTRLDAVRDALEDIIRSSKKDLVGA